MARAPAPPRTVFSRPKRNKNTEESAGSSGLFVVLERLEAVVRGALSLRDVKTAKEVRTRTTYENITRKNLTCLCAHYVRFFALS
jgi:hypothetical protein